MRMQATPGNVDSFDHENVGTDDFILEDVQGPCGEVALDDFNKNIISNTMDDLN